MSDFTEDFSRSLNREKLERLALVIKGGQTKRWHTWPVQRNENVAEHSYGVAWVCFYLADGKPSTLLLLSALVHDVPEHLFGDLPAQVKRQSQVLWDEMHRLESVLLNEHGINYMEVLTTEEKTILSLADTFDSLMFCVRERRSGNLNVGLPWHRCTGYLKDRLTEWRNTALADRAYDLLRELETTWRDINHG